MNFKFALFVLALSWLFCEVNNYSIGGRADNERSDRAEDGGFLGTIGRLLNPGTWISTFINFIPKSLIEFIIGLIPTSWLQTVLGLLSSSFAETIFS